MIPPLSSCSCVLLAELIKELQGQKIRLMLTSLHAPVQEMLMEGSAQTADWRYAGIFPDGSLIAPRVMVGRDAPPPQ